MKKKKTLRNISFSLIGIVLCTGIYFLFFSPDRKPSLQAPDKLILIIVDTLRADHLSCYGYTARTTKNIDRLAKSGILFSQAVSAIPETGPAVSTILTSLYPFHHGVRSNLYSLPREVVTWAQVLREQGFKTAAFTDKFPFRRLKILKGFDSLNKRDPNYSTEEEAVSSAVKQSLEWIKKNMSEKFFVLIHFYDPHIPYMPVKLSQETESLQYSGPYTGEYGPALALWHDRLPVEARDIEYMQSLYDDEVGFTDLYVGFILDEINKIGIQEETMIVLTADHGEAFGEHDYYFDHGDLLYEDQIRVPLIFSGGSRLYAGKKINAQVRTIDIIPTVLQLMNLQHERRVDGTSLAPLILGRKRLLETRYAYSESDAINFLRPNCKGYIDSVKGKHLSIRKDGMKLIYVPGHPEREFELYDLILDPLELSNLIMERPKEAREMIQYLRTWLAQQTELKNEAGSLDKKTEEILKSLGYIH